MDFETHIRLLEEKLEKKQGQLDRERLANFELRTKIKNMENTFAVNPADKWYLMYLMKELANLERVHEHDMESLAAYQEDHAKYGKFYHYCKLVHKDEIGKVE